MTNDELNRKVAELRGWKPWLEYTYRDGSVTRWRNEVHNYCDDPAAWGGLFTELAEKGHHVDLWYDNDNGFFDACIQLKHRTDNHSGVDRELPGRALCLAYVASQEGR